MIKEIEKENKFLIKRISKNLGSKKINYETNIGKDVLMMNKVLRMNWSIIIRFKIKQRYLAINKKLSDTKYKKYANDEWFQNKIAEVNKLREFRKTEFDDNEIIKYITNIDYKNKGFCWAKAILECIELNYEDSANEYNLLKKNKNSIQVEHIYPQTVNPKDDSYDCQRDKLWYLGNLSLLEGTINSDIKNCDFDKKKKGYRKSKMQITKQISHSSDRSWTDATIEKRGIDLAKQFIKFGE